MAKRRANGEGNIRKRKDGRWEGRYTAGYDPVTGKQVFKNVLGKTQAEVKEKLKKALQLNEKIDFTRTGKHTVSTWMEEWFENVCKIKARPSSHQTYRGYIDHHITPYIGKIPLEKLSTMDLQKLYRKLMSNGRVERIEAENQPKGLSAKTVRNINQVISSAMDFAVAQKIIPENPCKAVALPKIEHKEMQTIPAEQLQVFLTEARATGVYEMYYIELATGLRRGELLGLKWSDIDFENSIIHVTKSVEHIGDKPNIKGTKTDAGTRMVPLLDDLKEFLLEQPNRVPQHYIISDDGTSPLTNRRYQTLYEHFRETTGASCTAHQLRHSFATIAFESDVDAKAIQEIIGHKQLSTTMDIYTDFRKKSLQQAAEKLNKFTQKS